MKPNTVPAGGEAVPAARDPFLLAIAAYREAKKTFASIPDDVLTFRDEDAFVNATYGPAGDALRSWTGGAYSRKGAIEALKLMAEEDVLQDTMGEAIRTKYAHAREAVC